MDIHRLNIIIWMIIFSGVHCAVDIESVDKQIIITKNEYGYSLTMEENNHNFNNKKALFKIVADDCKVITISFSDKTFTYNIENCILYSLQSFDYEIPNERSYSMNIIDGTSSDTYVKMTITNIDDEPPILNCPSCSLDENTNYDKDNTSCLYKLEDPDGFLSYMTFTVNKGLTDDDQIFEVITIPGIPNNTYKMEVPLINLQTLDYETMSFYSFSITVTDSGNNSMTQNAIINVQDMRDTYPKWTKITNIAEFEEKSIQEYDVKAVDGDTGINSPICYEIIDQNDFKNHSDYNITIPKNTGHIIVNNIDRDEYDISMIEVTINACICNLDDWCTRQKLSYYIKDIDDHLPIIVKNTDINGTDAQVFNDTEQKIVNVEFLENFSGSFNFSSLIQDIDMGENAQFDVELEPVGDYDYTVAYIIVPTAGYKIGNFKISVSNKIYLDYENSTWRNHYFNVKSIGTVNNTHVDLMYVNISLIDYNDEIPIFDKDEYTQSIDETAKTGDFVLRAHAEDADAEDAVLKMEIVGNYAEKRLSIDSDGNIKVNLTNPDGGENYYFDFDILNSVFFQVRAIDHAKPPHITTVPVTLTIKDVNNKAPMIDPVDPVSVEENQVDGTALNVTIRATDPDTTGNLTAKIDWEKSYATKNSIRLKKDDKFNPEVIKFLKTEIQPVTGGREISISLTVTNSNETNPDKPDFETFDSLYLNLVVIDLNTDPEFLDKDRTSENILITIIDINDNPPYFPDSNNVTRNVQEGASEGTSVGFIQAIDPDIGDNITYRCTPAEDDFDWVIIDEINGAFSVKEDGKVDADDPPYIYKFTFKYVCYANDGVHDSEPLPVEFSITDTNNKKPHTNLNDTESVTEKSPKGTVFAALKRTDLDRDVPFHTVVCNFKSDPEYKDCAETFVINEDNILVHTDYLDRDHGTPSYSCKINCYDNPTNERSQGQNSVDKLITIELLDINDHAPTLITLDFDVSEKKEKEAKVADILASDIDYLENATIDFQIESILNDETGSDIKSFFKLQKESDYIVNDTLKMTHLYTTKDLRGSYGDYTIQLKLQDEGNPPMVTNISESRIKFTITKFNFNPPVIVFPKMDDVYPLLSSQEIGKPLIKFKSTDSLNDFSAQDGETKNCAKWDVTFTLSSEEDYGDIFTLDQLRPCVSQLQVTKNFESNKKINKFYKLKITAWNNSTVVTPNPDEQPYSSSVQFTIKFLDNSQEPFFSDDKPWEFNFKEDDTTQSKPLRNKATYDLDDNSTVYYFFVGEQNVGDIFDVDRITGTITVKEIFLYNDANYYKFQIVASNDTNPYSTLDNAYLNVTINVLSINRSPPSFTSDSFFGAIMPTYKYGSPVLDITATDPDAIDKGNLTYSIVGDIEKIGDGLDNIDKPPFEISTSKEDVGKIISTFNVESSMSGHFVFTVMVEDKQDEWGNGPHNASTTTTIFIITSDNTVDFKFLNEVVELQERQKAMLEIVTKVLKHSAYLQNIKQSTEDGQTFAVATLYFIEDSTTTTLITSEDILKQVTNVNTFGDLAKQLKTQSLYLYGFPSPDSKVNTDGILRKWLLGVSVVLGVFCLILLAALIWKTRQLNRRISQLTTRKFGSQDSGLNRLGVSAPTTNKHAIEGSNPVYKNDEIKHSKDPADFDTDSIRSGDSDLIGIENNPEFDYNFNTPSAPVDTNTYL